MFYCETIRACLTSPFLCSHYYLRSCYFSFGFQELSKLIVSPSYHLPCCFFSYSSLPLSIFISFCCHLLSSKLWYCYHFILFTYKFSSLPINITNFLLNFSFQIIFLFLN